MTDTPDALERARLRAHAAPMIPSLWMDFAGLLEAAGAQAEALEAWRMALALVPRSRPAGDAVDRLGELADAAPETRTATERPEEIEDAERDVFDIDALLHELESRPTGSERRFADEDADLPSTGSDDEIAATETLARIYESQNLMTEAALIYDLLADREADPSRAEIFRARAEDLRRRTS